MSIQITPAARNELAPSGTLRVGLNMQNFLLVNKDPKSGEPVGMFLLLGKELFGSMLHQHDRMQHDR